MATQQAYLSPALNKVCYMWATYEFLGWLAQMAAAALCSACVFCYSLFVWIHWTISCCVTSFSTKKHLLVFLRTYFKVFLPSFCAAVCHCCEALVCTLYTGGLCAFPCLSPCSHSNLLPGSLPLPFPLSAWPVVAMPPHCTVIVWRLMATMISVCRLQGDCLYADCKLLFSHSLKWLLALNEPKNANNLLAGTVYAYFMLFIYLSCKENQTYYFLKNKLK